MSADHRADVGDPEPGSTRVLVVDDDPGVRTLVVFVLERAGYRVLEAADGQVACDTVQERGDELDVVLLDVRMPRMDGHEALPTIRVAQPGLPVIFYSGFDHNEVAQHLTSPSAYTSFLPKPFENDELLDEVARAAGHRR